MSPTARRSLAVLRLLTAALVLAALAATVLEAAGRTRINPFNLFGYFTVQSNVILAVVLAVAGARLLRDRPVSDALVAARACAVSYIAVVGLVFAVLLAPLGAAGGVPVPWANTVLHVVTPVVGVVDWLVGPDRRRLGARTVALALTYPAVWVAVVLVRGATDGWFPYPFLDPATGYGRIAGYVAAIAVTVATAAALVVAASRLPVGRRVAGPAPAR